MFVHSWKCLSFLYKSSSVAHKQVVYKKKIYLYNRNDSPISIHCGYVTKCVYYIRNLKED